MVISGVLGRIKGFLFAGNHQIAPVGAHSNQLVRGITNKTYPSSWLRLRYTDCANILSIYNRYKRRFRA